MGGVCTVKALLQGFGLGCCCGLWQREAREVLRQMLMQEAVIHTVPEPAHSTPEHCRRVEAVE